MNFSTLVRYLAKVEQSLRWDQNRQSVNPFREYKKGKGEGEDGEEEKDKGEEKEKLSMTSASQSAW